MHKKEVKALLTILAEKYPVPETALNFSTPFELLVATIMSAQTTDKQVNRVTEELFKEYNTPEDFCKMSKEELAEKICSIGLYRNKSKYIIKTSKLLLTKYKGKVPHTRKELMELPGVGRKTANVVLICAFGKNTIPVDTHVFRVANRIGLVKADNVEEVEKELEKIIPQKSWGDLHHRLIFLGREVCKARKPDCENCPVKNFCFYFNNK